MTDDFELSKRAELEARLEKLPDRALPADLTGYAAFIWPGRDVKFEFRTRPRRLRHRNGGSTYVVLSESVVLKHKYADCPAPFRDDPFRDPADGDVLVLYMKEATGELYVRPAAHFDNFEEVK